MKALIEHRDAENRFPGDANVKTTTTTFNYWKCATSLSTFRVLNGNEFNQFVRIDSRIF